MFKPDFALPSMEFKYPVSVLGLKKPQILNLGTIFGPSIMAEKIPRFRNVVQHLCSRNPVSANGFEVDVQITLYQKMRPKSMFKIPSIRKRAPT